MSDRDLAEFGLPVRRSFDATSTDHRVPMYHLGVARTDKARGNGWNKNDLKNGLIICRCTPFTP